MSSISADLYKRLREVLLECGPFDSISNLKAVFTDNRIEEWKNELPDTGDSASERVNAVIDFLLNAISTSEENPLVLFLYSLCDQKGLRDGCHAQLEALAGELERELSSVVKPQVDSFASVKFVNRTEELDLVFQSMLPVQYWIIDAPAGYGKTWFLQELKRRYEIKQWFCMSLAAPKVATLETLVQQIMHELGISSPADTEVEHTVMGRRIASYFLEKEVISDGEPIQLSKVEYRGICLFIDNYERLENESLKQLVQLVIGIFEGLKNSRFIDNRHNRLRVFFAGRNFGKKSLIFREIPCARLSLSPYRFSVIQETVQVYISESGASFAIEEIASIASQLMYLYGGHPKCISDTLEELAKEHFANIVSLHDTHDIFLERAFSVCDSLSHYNRDVLNLLPVLETLSVFRYYGVWLLQSLIDKDSFQWEEDGYKLEEKLLETFLIERDEGFLKDSITRRLLSIRLRSKHPMDFNNLCRDGVLMYKQRLLSPQCRHPERIAVEYLYQWLHYAYYAKEIYGQDLISLSEKVLCKIKKILMRNWKEREVLVDFLRLLEKDWELKFFINYFLSDKNYSQEPYQQIIAFATEEFAYSRR